MRTFLASALFARPDVLLLDEPTNHLSIAAVLWLARELTTSEIWADRVVVCVSHDRNVPRRRLWRCIPHLGHCRDSRRRTATTRPGGLVEQKS